MRHRRRYPVYTPVGDGSLTMWVDPSDSTKVLAVGGGAISNGATIGTVNTSAGTARAFTQWGANARPTWDSAGINGLGAVRCNSQILSTTTVTGFASMGGLTCLVVFKASSIVTGSCALSLTEIDSGSGFYDISLMQMRTGGSYEAGGRRLTSDAFVSAIGNVTPTTFILGATFDYTNAALSIFESGVKGPQGRAFQTTGTTGAGEPHVISIGGVAQQTGTSVFGLCNGWVGESLTWVGAVKTPDQLVAPFAYLRRKWGVL